MADVFFYCDRRIKVTSLMNRVAEELDCTLGPDFVERLIEKFDELGLTATADLFGILNSTLNYWFLKLGIDVKTVAVPPGYHVEVLANKA